jgi:hypothetical protein
MFLDSKREDKRFWTEWSVPEENSHWILQGFGKRLSALKALRYEIFYIFIHSHGLGWRKPK